jgi:hypothetical protein
MDVKEKLAGGPEVSGNWRQGMVLAGQVTSGYFPTQITSVGLVNHGQKALSPWAG